MGLGGIGAPERVVILLLALLIFGPSRLAEVGSSLGRAVRDFRRALQDEGHGGPSGALRDPPDEDGVADAGCDPRRTGDTRR